MGWGRRMDGCTYGVCWAHTLFEDEGGDWVYREKEGRLVHIDTLPKMMKFCMLMILGRSMICAYKCSKHPSRECIVSWFIMPLNDGSRLVCVHISSRVRLRWLVIILVGVANPIVFAFLFVGG